MLKNHEFDYFLYGLKSQSQSGLYEEIASKLATFCRVPEADLVRLIEDAKEKQRAGIGEGVAFIDVQSPVIKNAAMALCLLDHKIGFESPDGQASDIVAVVLSPQEDGALHLQRLSSVTICLRDRDLCSAIREARDEDSMRVLFMMPEEKQDAAAA